MIQEIDFLHVDPLFLFHLHFHVIDLKIFFLDIVSVLEMSILFELHHVQSTLNFINNKQTPGTLTILLSEKNCQRSFFISNSRNRQYFRI